MQPYGLRFKSPYEGLIWDEYDSKCFARKTRLAGRLKSSSKRMVRRAYKRRERMRVAAEIRNSLLSFEELWNAPGMEAYDHL